MLHFLVYVKVPFGTSLVKKGWQGAREKHGADKVSTMTEPELKIKKPNVGISHLWISKPLTKKNAFLMAIKKVVSIHS